MLATPVSLLERLRLQPDPASWERLVDLYTPLVRNQLRRYGLQDPDVDDLLQETLQILVRELPHFQHEQRPGAFRRWLRIVTLNRLREFWRSRRSRPQTPGSADLETVLHQLEDPSSNLTRMWDQEHDHHVARRLLELLAPEFEPATWDAFRLLVLEGKETAAVARQLGISPNAVRIAKSRVLSRLRHEAAGLID